MENIKTFETLEEASEYKPIWPEYDLQYDDFSAGIKTEVRKQSADGIWHLIPVIQRYEFAPFTNDGDFEDDQEINITQRTKEITDFIQRFNIDCYKVLLFWKFPESELVTPNGKLINGKLDDDQRSEEDRLNLYYYKKNE